MTNAPILRGRHFRSRTTHWFELAWLFGSMPRSKNELKGRASAKQRLTALVRRKVHSLTWEDPEAVRQFPAFGAAVAFRPRPTFQRTPPVRRNNLEGQLRGRFATFPKARRMAVIEHNVAEDR
jgi:hypothetical protein